MPLNGRVQCIDHCISQIIAALNAGGVQTIASCCGHKRMLGEIMLRDGRELLVVKNRDEAKRIVKWYGKDMSYTPPGWFCPCR